jgi:hypothetical protein
VTNRRGFRNVDEIDDRPPDGKLRIICIGDSFTSGYGVANEETWCARLAALDDRYQTVNMGQGGYGIDQAYLWYVRDGTSLESHVRVFAFIGDDFRRMQEDHFLGYGKLLLTLQGGELKVSNTPIPRRGFVVRWLAQNGHLFRNLRMIELTNRVASRLEAWSSQTLVGASREETWRVAAAVFDELASQSEADGGMLLLVFLPTPWDYDTDLYDDWRNRVAVYSERKGVPMIDTVEKLRALERDEALGLFIPYGQVGAPHLNETGHEWVASQVLDRIRTWRVVPGSEQPSLH